MRFAFTTQAAFLAPVKTSHFARARAFRMQVARRVGELILAQVARRF